LYAETLENVFYAFLYIYYTAFMGIFPEILRIMFGKKAHKRAYKAGNMHEYTHIVHILLNIAPNYCILNAYDV